MDSGSTIAVAMLLFVALVVVFVALGSALLAHFWLRRYSVTVRALAATALAAVVLLFPFGVLSTGGETSIVLPVGAAVIAVLGFPTAFLAGRKLERQKPDGGPDIGSVFE